MTEIPARLYYESKVVKANVDYEKKINAGWIGCGDPEPLIVRLYNERLSRTIVRRIDIEYMTRKKSMEVAV